MQKGIICENGISPSIFNSFDSVYSGHFHHTSKLSNISYLGNFAQFYWDDYKTDKGFDVLDTKTFEKVRVKNTYDIFHKYFYNDQESSLQDMLDDINHNYDGTYVKLIVDHRENHQQFDSFVKEFENRNLIDLKIIEDIIDLDEMKSDEIVNDAEDTLTILGKYTREVDSSSNRLNVESFLSSLYREAAEIK
jgi:hypothetical protein